MVRRLVVWAAVVMMAGLGGARDAAAREIKVSGLAEVRYVFWDSDLNKRYDSFDLRRLRLKADGEVNDRTTFSLQFDLAPLDWSNRGRLASVDLEEIELKTAVIERRLNDKMTMRAGFASVPFGYGVPTGCRQRLPFERSKVEDYLFPGARDLGLYFAYRPADSRTPQVDLGYGNGLRNWYRRAANGDVDVDATALIARVQWPLANKSVAGVSYMMGDRTRTVAGVDTKFSSEDVLGFHLRYNLPQTWAFQAEYFTGTSLNTDVDGYYGMVEHKLQNRPATVFYRYDSFDDGQMTTRNHRGQTFGVAWDVGKNERLTAQVEDLRNNDATGTRYTNFGLMWQVVY